MFDVLGKLLRKTPQRPSRTLALYGPRTEALDLLAGLDWILRWVDKLGLPEAEWVTWNYGGPGDRHYKSYKMASWNKRGRPLPDAKCISVQTGRFVEGSKKGRTDDVWYASLDIEPDFVLGVDMTATDLSDEVFTMLAVDIQQLGCFDYGYVFEMPMEKSPSTYERGLLFGGPSSGLSATQKDEISKWGNARGACSSWLDDTVSHYLRDIYPLNFLNPHHLAMQVKGQSLQDWIAADPKRGSLKPLIEDTLWTWTVPANRIQSIRKVLGPERLLISWGDFDTPSGGPLGHTYGKAGTGPVFNGKPLTNEDERWIAAGLEKMKPIFARYTGESPDDFDRLIARREPRFGQLLDTAFTAWSQDTRPDRPTADEALQAFAAALGEHLVKHYLMGWYAVEDEHGRSLGVAHRGKGGAQTWSYPIDAIAKRIDRREIGFVAGIVEAVGNEIERG